MHGARPDGLDGDRCLIGRGRRTLIVIGLVIWAIGLALFPMAESVFQLYIYRFVVAVGVAIASVMVIAAMQDYPQEVSRGKWSGVNSFVTSFAILFLSLVVVRLPNMLTDAGFDSVQAGRITFWIGSGLALFAAVICWLGYYGGKIAASAETRSPFAGVVDGLREGRRNPRLALAYGSAFAARGDLVIIGAFFSLWFVRAGAEQNVSTGDALVRAGITMSALLVATWIWAPLFGYLIDRIDRVTALTIAMFLAAIGYFVIGTVGDPYNMTVMVPATFMLGIGEISAIVAGNTLLGEQAPARMRGAVVGVFGLIGTVGILFATYFGGQIFDKIAYSAPFTMMAGVNAVIAIWALFIRFRTADTSTQTVGSPP